MIGIFKEFARVFVRYKKFLNSGRACDCALPAWPAHARSPLGTAREGTDHLPQAVPAEAAPSRSRLRQAAHAREADSAHPRRRAAAPPGGKAGKGQQPRECAFCKRNGETRSFASTHVVRDSFTGLVVCPILRKHTCELCGATGDFSHTRSYCPQKTDDVFNMSLLKKTARNSTDKRKQKT